MQHLKVVLAIGCTQALIRVYGLFLGLFVLATALALALLLWLICICFSPRSLTLSQSQSEPTIKANVSANGQKSLLLGQPLLLPTQVSHTRLGPGHYNYTVPHFLVGVPVGLRGPLGGLLSIDEPSRCRLKTEGSSPSCTQSPGLVQYLSPNLGSWFTVHAHHHLEKGDELEGIGLGGKMRNYLVSQGENPYEYPHAYLLTMPQFLGYQRNLVCMWYLYSCDRELTAMIMEVNNYWGQRKIAFCKLKGEGPLLSSLSTKPDAGREDNDEVDFCSSRSRFATYCGTWNKDMFISPFEKVGGVISLRVSDPLALGPNADSIPLQITITLLSPSGKPTVIGRVFNPEDGRHEPIDPLTASRWTLLKFLPYWTAVLVVTELMIVASALWIKSKGVKMYSAPEVKRGNFPREETGVERDLEGAFRSYLRHLVTSRNWPQGVGVEYIPSKSHYLRPETFASHNPTPTNPELPPTTVTIQPLTPAFYTHFASHNDALIAFQEESRFVPVDSDPHSQRLYISHPEIFFKILDSSPLLAQSSLPFQPLNCSAEQGPSLARRVLSYFRGSREGYFFDDFVEEFLSPSEQNTYFWALLKHVLSEKIAFGVHGLLSLYGLLVYLVVNVGVSWLLFGVLLPKFSGLSFGYLAGGGFAMACHWGALSVFSRTASLT
ncbi:hypothetical protein BDV06DRAFT_223674 [Aspergillus oleicola]